VRSRSQTLTFDLSLFSVSQIIRVLWESIVDSDDRSRIRKITYSLDLSAFSANPLDAVNQFITQLRVDLMRSVPSRIECAWGPAHSRPWACPYYRRLVDAKVSLSWWGIRLGLFRFDQRSEYDLIIIPKAECFELMYVATSSTAVLVL
jgi:hypothetical protein